MLSRLGRLYVAVVGVVGAVALVEAIRSVSVAGGRDAWIVLAVLTWVAGSFAIKVPGVQATVYVSEPLVFTVILLYGAAPAIVTIAIDGLLISLRRRNREPERIVFNFAEPVISVWLAAELFFVTAGVPPLSVGRPPLAHLLLPVLLMSCTFFLSNSWLNAFAVASETRQSPYRVWRQYFLWLWLNYVGSASLALMLAVSAPNVSLSALGVIVPLLIISYLTFKTAMARVEEANQHLAELNKLYLSTVETLAMSIDAKDQLTYGHIRRVQTYAVGLAHALGLSDQKQLKAIEAAALLHDMGKLAVPEHILNKPGRLSSAEYERMKLHAPVGATILSAIDFPYPVVPIVRHHHENWDGTGYPDGLKGLDIPFGARIMSVVDCFDALTSDRPYRPALPADEALSIIGQGRGTKYDPLIVDKFAGVYAEVRGGDTEDPGIVRHVLDQFARPMSTPDVDTPSACATSSEVSAADEILQLGEAAEELSRHATLDDAAEVMSQHLRRLLPASLVAFFVSDPAAQTVRPIHVSGPGADALADLRIPLGSGLSGWVALNRSTMVNAHPALDLGDRAKRLPIALQSALSTPLVADGGFNGVLTLYASPPDAFTDDHRRIVQIAALQIGAGLHRAACLDETRASRARDGLTGLPTSDHLAHLLALRSAAENQPGLAFGVLCLTLSGGGGDEQVTREHLKEVVGVIRRTVRSTDMVFRSGDYELVIVIPDSNPAGTAAVADRILNTVIRECPGVRSELHPGLAFPPADGGTVGELLEHAKGRSAKSVAA